MTINVQDPRPFAAFDLDGTLVRWQLFHAIFERLSAKGCFSAANREDVKRAYRAWKNREMTFGEYEKILVSLYENDLHAVDPAIYDEAIEEIFDTYKDQVFTYPRALIKSLKSEGYLIFAISGSQEDIVLKMAEHYGFDYVVAAKAERVEGRFTGKRVTPIFGKGAVLRGLVAKHGATFAGSVAVGDGESDIPMLELVERPVAFNPSRGLAKVAQERGWPIVLERKNAVYELTPVGWNILP